MFLKSLRVRLAADALSLANLNRLWRPSRGAIDYFERQRNIAEAFPDLPKSEREFLISGTSPEGWVQRGAATADRSSF